MPMSVHFKNRLFPNLRDIAECFGTPCHIYDEQGILSNGERFHALFGGLPGGWREYFAVKANPNPTILKMMKRMGFGFDCSSVPELRLVWDDQIGIGARREDMMFTSNNTGREQYVWAARTNAILNLDDLSFVKMVPEPFPDLICFRINPGRMRKGGNAIIGKPEEAKYGLRMDQILQAYRLAMERGAYRAGIHAMVVSNELDYRQIVLTVVMLLEVAKMLKEKLGISVEFINIGGGIGIPYRPNQKKFDLDALSKAIAREMSQFERENGFVPKLLMENGRCMTGPYGVLVTRVINRMEKYRRNVGVDASMACLMRPAMYDAYHHIYVPGKEHGSREVVDVVGPLCENNDKFAKQRRLPKTKVGDLVVIADTGAHGIAMGFQYNGQLPCQELLMRHDGSVERIARAVDFSDYKRRFTYPEQFWYSIK